MPVALCLNERFLRQVFGLLWPARKGSAIANEPGALRFCKKCIRVYLLYRAHRCIHCLHVSHRALSVYRVEAKKSYTQSIACLIETSGYQGFANVIVEALSPFAPAS